MMDPGDSALGNSAYSEHQYKKASSYLVMCIVGGAVFPICMGLVGKNSMSLGFILPLISFAFIAFFGMMHAVE